MREALLLLFAYLVGSIPCGLLLGLAVGVDVRKGGSGNIGATNVNRQLGRKLGLLTLIGDAAKAVLPMLLASTLAGDATLVALAGAAAFLGHLFPVYLRFHGGKGVATALGMWLYLSPFSALVLMAVFAVTVAASGFVSAGSLAAAAALPLVLWLRGAPAAQPLIALLMAALIWFKHSDNIGRLRRGEEKSWKDSGGRRGEGK
ncbi:MAG: glycerol-3-phosphate 1-O-acyltransferase PlsY [Thermodesulfobacteriota bacterium]